MPIIDGGDYETWLRSERDAKDDHFRFSPNSPIPPEERPGFTGLSYFPPDPSFRRTGLMLEPYGGPGEIEFEIETSDGQKRAGRRVGQLSIDLGGSTLRLAAYRLAGARGHELFVPFADATSGTLTYGGGRYLDLEPDAAGAYTLDFNLAYHPYCVYAPFYSCPLPPSENRLPVAIKAGELLPSSQWRRGRLDTAEEWVQALAR